MAWGVYAQYLVDFAINENQHYEKRGWNIYYILKAECVLHFKIY